MRTLPLFLFTASAFAFSPSTVPAAVFDVAVEGDLIVAIISANGASDKDTINITVSSIVLTTPLPAITEPLILQSSLSMSHLDGSSVSGHGLSISGADCEIYSLEISGFSSDGIFVEGTGAIIGAPGQGNVVHSNGVNGIHFDTAADGGVVQGNIVGLLPDGTTAAGNNAGIILRGTNHTVGGDTAGERNVVASSTGGRGIGVRAGSGHVVSGNYVGTDVTGTLARPNSAGGILVNLGTGTIGGATAAEGNLISGNSAEGIRVDGINDAVISHNLIGVSSAGDPLGNSGAGIVMLNASGGTISNNTIANNAIGITVQSSVSGITVSGNTIEDNLGDGITADGDAFTIDSNSFANQTGDHIRLGSAASGVMLSMNTMDENCNLPISYAGTLQAVNDALDVDSGANGLQNFPILDPFASGAIAITGTLESEPSTSYLIELFSSTAAHPSGFGPGMTVLDQQNCFTNGSGQASFIFPFVGPFPAGTVLTAIATNQTTGASSHFSPISTETSSVSDWLHLEH